MLLLTPPGNGAAGRSRTCIGPFRRRMPRLVRPRQRKGSARQEWASQALQIGLPRWDLRFANRSAPAIPRAQAEDVAATRRAGSPSNAHTSVRGLGGHGAPNLGTVLRGKSRKVADPKGLAPSTLPQTTGRSTLSYGSGTWWEVLVTLQPSLPALLATPHLQCGSRITSRRG